MSPRRSRDRQGSEGALSVVVTVGIDAPPEAVWEAIAADDQRACW